MPDTDPSLGLPGRFGLAGFDGSLQEWLQHLEWQYRAIVSDAGIRLWGKPLKAAGRKAADGRDLRFWHLITTGDEGEASRKLDLERCAMLPRVWDLLERLAAGDPRACWWHDRGHVVIVAPVDFSLKVVLYESRTSFVLLTAFPVRKQRKRAKLMDRAAASWLTGRSRRDAHRHPLWHQGRPVPRWAWEGTLMGAAEPSSKSKET